jgi:hypothetical protein
MIMMMTAPSATHGFRKLALRSLLDSWCHGLIVPPPRLSTLGALRTNNLEKAGPGGQLLASGRRAPSLIVGVSRPRGPPSRVDLGDGKEGFHTWFSAENVSFVSSARRKRKLPYFFYISSSETGIEQVLICVNPYSLDRLTRTRNLRTPEQILTLSVYDGLEPN